MRIFWQAAAAVALFVVPVTSPDGWIEWGYGNVPRHVVTRSADGLRVAVTKSAGAVAYRLPEPLAVRAIEASGRIEGPLNVTGERQGQTGHDDFTLRVGLVTKGTRRLGRFERWFAPGWIKQLHDLAPAGTGIADVRFFNLGAPGAALGVERRHPLHELLRETIVAIPEPDGTFRLQVRLDAPVETIAIWIGADGDDTASTFTLSLAALRLETTALR